MARATSTRGDRARLRSIAVGPATVERGPPLVTRLDVTRPGGRRLAPIFLKSLSRELPFGALAFNHRGDLLVVCVGPRGGVQARVLRADGILGAAHTLGVESQEVWAVAALADDGTALVAWDSAYVDEGYYSRRYVRASLRPARAQRFGRAEVLDDGRPGTDEPDGAAVYALAASVGRRGAFVLWERTRRARKQSLLQYATASPGGTFGARRGLSAPRTEPTSADTAVTPHGAVLVAWKQDGSILARVRPAAHRQFGPIEVVAADRAAGSPRAAFTPAGRPVIRWNRPGGRRTARRLPG